jgi:succinate dehydrogenase / fumarate reductase flavoprotein subunit
MDLVRRKFEVIIIGSGGAGLMAAISCLRYGIKNIAIVSKVIPTLSHTVAAKGGINAALGNKTADNWHWHAYDTIKSGDFIADHDAVEYMCRAAPEAIINLEKMGVAFARFDNGKIYQRPYGGQTVDYGKGGIAYRACSAKDDIGHSILHSLYSQCLKNGVVFLNEFFVTDLLVENKEVCYGAVAIDLNEGAVNVLEAGVTIVATGGHSQIYQNTTTSSICTGDGGAAILRAGLQLQDMEFVQFHPTGLYGSGLLVTEAARGEGAYLVNSVGQRFMEYYAPNYLDLASRDVVARAMSTEIHRGYGCGKNKEYLHLILSDLDKKNIFDKLPGVVKLAKSFAGIDVTREPIPVVPVAHYTMGGIPTNMNCEVVYFDEAEKKVDGLLAIGEAACASVHGANRLGCNSLLDIVVFGDLSGKIAANSILKSKRIPEDLINKLVGKISNILVKEGSFNANEIKVELKKITWQFAGVFRNKLLLEKGLSEVKRLQENFAAAAPKNKSLFWNNELGEYLETEN